MMSRIVHIIFFICLIIVLIDSRQSLRDYVVSQDSLSGLGMDQFSVYDRSEQQLLCRLEYTDYAMNRLTNLISYPSHQSIGSIRNVWSPFLYQGQINVLDDEINKWIKGQIYQVYRPQAFRFTIEYGGQYYTMENKFGSLITDIRSVKRPNILLTRFQQISLNQMFGSTKYNVRVYTDELPDPIYMLALYALDSTTLKRRRIQFIP